MRALLLLLVAGCYILEEDPLDDDLVDPSDPPPSCTLHEESYTIAVGTEPTGLDAAWFVNGRPDTIAVTNTGSNTLSLVRRIDAPVPYAVQTLPTGTAPTSVRLLDIDRVWHEDIDIITNDIVVANSGDDTISIYRNDGWDPALGPVEGATTGPATFAAPQTIAVGAHPIAIAPIYDGAIDPQGHSVVHLAVANRDGDNITILRNDGTGAFVVWGELAVGNAPIALGSFDADGDAYGDLAVLHAGDETLGILHGGPNLLAWSAMTTYPVGREPVSMEVMSWEVYVTNRASADITRFETTGTELVSTTLPVGGVPTASIGSLVADYELGVARPLSRAGLGTGEGLPTGPHPTALVSAAVGSRGHVVAANTDTGTITIAVRYCTFESESQNSRPGAPDRRSGSTNSRND